MFKFIFKSWKWNVTNVFELVNSRQFTTKTRILLLMTFIVEIAIVKTIAGESLNIIFYIWHVFHLQLYNNNIETFHQHLLHYTSLGAWIISVLNYLKQCCHSMLWNNDNICWDIFMKEEMLEKCFKIKKRLTRGGRLLNNFFKSRSALEGFNFQWKT